MKRNREYFSKCSSSSRIIINFIILYLMLSISCLSPHLSFAVTHWGGLVSPARDSLWWIVCQFKWTCFSDSWDHGLCLCPIGVYPPLPWRNDLLRNLNRQCAMQYLPRQHPLSLTFWWGGVLWEAGTTLLSFGHVGDLFQRLCQDLRDSFLLKYCPLLLIYATETENF